MKVAGRAARVASPFVFALALGAAAASAAAQEHAGDPTDAGHHEARPRHRLALFTGNTWVPQGNHEGAIDGLIAAPTIGIDYAFRFGERFALSWINDFQIARYVIERADGSELERERLFVTSVVLVWEAVHRLQLFAGPRQDVKEFLCAKRLLDEVHGAQLHRLDRTVDRAEGSHHDEPHPWDVALNVAWDFKEEYDAVAIGISIGRLWQ